MKTGLALISLLILPCMAQAEFPSIQWDLGLAVKATQSPFVEGDTQLGVKPLVLDTSGFDIDGPAWSFIKAPTSQYYIGAGLDDWDYERGDSPALKDMYELDRAINLRLGAAWKVGSGVTLFDVAKDVAAHEGVQVKARYTYNPEPYQARLRPYGELQWLSADVADYYVGVKTNEAKVGRPAYQADSAYALKAGVSLEQPLSPRLMLVGEASVTNYSSEIKDSPIIENSSIWGGYLGLRYNWE